MENNEVQRMLRLILKALYFLRIWKKKEQPTQRIDRKIFFMIYYLLFQIFLVTCSIQSPDANEAIFLASVEVLLSVVTVKLICLLWNKDDIYGLIFEPITTHSTHDVDAELANAEIKIFMKFIHSYIAMMFCSFISYVFGNLPMVTDDRKLPFFISYTLEGQYSEQIYWIAYVFLVSEIFLGFACTLINIMIWYAMFNYSLEYRALGNQMKNLGTNSVKRFQPPGRIEFHRDLVKLIKNHRNLSKYLKYCTVTNLWLNKV